MHERLESFWHQRIDDVTELALRLHGLLAAIDEGHGNKHRTNAELIDTAIQLGKARRDLADCDTALQRAVKGTYGFCGHCGAAIEATRLESFPAAKLCASCQFWSRQG
jgi:hypothetical protein